MLINQLISMRKDGHNPKIRQDAAIALDYITQKYEVIILGDFNDFDGEVLDVNNNKPTSQVLNIFNAVCHKLDNYVKKVKRPW